MLSSEKSESACDTRKEFLVYLPSCAESCLQNGFSMEKSKMISGGETLRFVRKDVFSGKGHVYRSTDLFRGLEAWREVY